MSADVQDKLAQYNEFFSIEHNFNANVSPLANDQPIDYHSFLNSIPTPFKMAGDLATLDQAALKPLQALSGVAGQLVDYLNHQAQKIDLMMSYIINQEDIESARYQGTSFGGGGFSFTSEQVFNLGQLIEVKIFITSDNCSVYCIGEIIEQQNTLESEEHKTYDYKVIYHFIRDEDRDLLVRASLHKQSQQLQQLASKRRQQK